MGIYEGTYNVLSHRDTRSLFELLDQSEDFKLLPLLFITRAFIASMETAHSMNNIQHSSDIIENLFNIYINSYFNCTENFTLQKNT